MITLGARPADLLHERSFVKRVLSQSCKAFQAERAALYLFNPNRSALELEQAVGTKIPARYQRLTFAQGVVGWVASRGIAARADLQETDGVLGKTGSEMAAPLSEGDHSLGVLVIGTRRKKFFVAGQEKQLADLAREAAGWLGLAWRVAGTQEENLRSAALAEVGAAIGAEETAQAILTRVVKEAARLCGAKLSSLFLWDKKTDKLSLEVCLGGSRRYRMQAPLLSSETALGYVVRRGKTFTVSQAEESPQDPHTDLIVADGLISLLAVPLQEKNQGVGVLCVATRQARRFSDAEIRLLQGLAGLAAAALGRARLAAQLDQTEEELRNRERLSSLGMLAAEVAHEVRNPLAVVRLLWHTAIRGLPTSEEQSKDLSLIETKLGQMNGILDRILNLARSADPQMERVDAGELFTEVALLTRAKCSAARIRTRLNLPPPQVAQVRGDRVQLEQAILNLVLNAMEAMSKGGELKLSVQIRGENVLLAVQDSGRGMSQEVSARLFEPFLTRRVGGTGLGMALVRRTVEAHGGGIRVQSSPGRGTKVEIRLPVWAETKS